MIAGAKMYESIIILGIFLAATGIFLIFGYIVLNAIVHTGATAKIPSNRIETGGMIMVGPIPIVFGSNSEITFAVEVGGMALFVVAIIFFFFSRYKTF